VRERREQGSNAAGGDKDAYFAGRSCRRRRQGNFGRPQARKHEIAGKAAQERKAGHMRIWNQMWEEVIGERECRDGDVSILEINMASLLET
jgi:hypothetical protein